VTGCTLSRVPPLIVGPSFPSLPFLGQLWNHNYEHHTGDNCCAAPSLAAPPCTTTHTGEVEPSSGVASGTIPTLFITVSHCYRKKILISVGVAAPTTVYLASSVPQHTRSVSAAQSDSPTLIRVSDRSVGRVFEFKCNCEGNLDLKCNC
jgi:hypothetical protein